MSLPTVGPLLPRMLFTASGLMLFANGSIFAAEGADLIILAAMVGDYRDWWLTVDCGSCGPRDVPLVTLLPDQTTSQVLAPAPLQVMPGCGRQGGNVERVAGLAGAHGPHLGAGKLWVIIRMCCRSQRKHLAAVEIRRV